MMRLTFLCNASTDAVRRGAFPTDEPLDIHGRADAIALAPSLKKADRVLTSPALRARETAKALGLGAEVDASLRDIYAGRWAGLTIEEVSAREPEAVALWQSDAAATPHGGEPIVALFERVQAFLDLRSRETGTLLAVTHTAVIRAAIAVAIGAPFASFWRIDVAPLGRATLHGEDGRWRLRSIEK